VKPIGVVGNLSRDQVGGTSCPGGGPYHSGRALRALRRPAVVATKCAAADRPDLLRPLAALGIPVHWHDAAVTAAFSFDYEGERRRMTVDAIGDPWTPDDARGWLATALRGVGWLHVAPLARTDFPAETLAELARARRLSLDGQGLVRPASTGPLALDGDVDRGVLRHVTVLKLSEEEALALLGDLEERSLRELGVPEVVVTLGSRGAIVCTDGIAEHVPTRPLDADPTGAGDAFAVGYLAARSSGLSPTAAAGQASALVGRLLTERPS
jgi:sugar/nucleoside kinase (ribokinase family)